MGKRIDREGPIHKAIVHYLRRVLPKNAIIHHSRNEGNRGGMRGVRDGARGKAMGIKPGFPDLLIFTGGVGYCVEVKAEGGKMSTAQRAVRAELEKQEIPYAVCRSVEDMRETLAEWGVRTSEKVA